MSHLALRCCPGRHRTAPLTVRLAQEIAASSRLLGPGSHDLAPGEVQVAIEAPGPLLGRFCALWHLVAPWPGSQLLLDGHPLAGTPRWRLTHWLQCLVRAQSFEPPPRYCRSGAVPPGVPLPWLPCRLWAGSWLSWVRTVEWERPERARDQARAALAELGVLACPFLALDGWERLLALSPADRLLLESFPPAGGSELA